MRVDRNGTVVLIMISVISLTKIICGVKLQVQFLDSDIIAFVGPYLFLCLLLENKHNS